MAMSMTGYGEHVIKIEGVTVTVEIRSINSRYLDFVPKIPRVFNFLEADIKRIVQSHFQRGRIEVYITLSGNNVTKKKLHIDWEMVDQYIDQLKAAQERYHLPGNIPLSMLTEIDGLFNIQETDENLKGLKRPILEGIQHSCVKVMTVREQEGHFLMQDILKRLEIIESMLKLLQKHQVDVSVVYRERIEDRIKDFLNEKVTINEDRLYQEIALLAEKGDITEEVIRLYSHLKQFKATVTSADSIGRKLDFITQEMHREVNTIGAKSLDTKISESVITIKSNIEKIKEQIQNIE